MSVQKDIENYFVEIITKLPEFKGQVKHQWDRSICQNSMNRQRIEVEDSDIRAATEWIKSIEKGKQKIQVLLVANCREAPDMRNVRRFLLSDLPGIVITSYGAKLSQVIIGEFENRRVAVLLTHTVEGLNLYESYFLLRVFDSLRVSRVHYLFQAFSEESHCGIKDYVSFRLHGTVCWPRFSPSELTSTGEPIVMAFSGPTFPSIAEISMCERLGFVPTVANMGVLSSASTLGLPHSASFFGRQIPETVSPSMLSWILELQVRQISRHLLHDTRGTMHTPSSPEQLEELASTCRQYAQEVTLVLTEAKASQYFTVIDTWNFDKLPFSIHFTEEKVMIIEGSPVLLHEGNHSEMMYPYFLSNLIGCKTMVIFDRYYPVTPSEQWVRVTKHCGFSNFNPLFGKNIDKWGVRFPDMSNCYDFDPHWSEELGRSGVSYCEGGVVSTSTERLTTSHGILKVAEFLEAKGVVQHGIYAAIISQHKLEKELPRKVAFYAYPDSISDEQVQMISGLVKGLVNSQ